MRTKCNAAVQKNDTLDVCPLGAKSNRKLQQKRQARKFSLNTYVFQVAMRTKKRQRKIEFGTCLTRSSPFSSNVPLVYMHWLSSDNVRTYKNSVCKYADKRIRFMTP